jgi:hypothetical protein
MLRPIMWMARKSKVTLRAKKQRLQSEYRKALAERRRLISYLSAAEGILSKPEMALLADFAEIAKQKCDRLKRALHRVTRHAA